MTLRSEAFVIASRLGIPATRLTLSDRMPLVVCDGVPTPLKYRVDPSSKRITLYVGTLRALWSDDEALTFLPDILTTCRDLKVVAPAKTLYVNRPLRNADALIAWAKANGFTDTMAASELHVTIAFSKTPVDWSTFSPDSSILTVTPTKTSVTPLGDEGAVVLKFDSEVLQARWQELVDGGATWSYPNYQPHVTITYDGADVDLTKVKPYTGPLVFGPEAFAEVDEDWSKDFDESKHPRDEAGRWSDGGGESGDGGDNITAKLADNFNEWSANDVAGGGGSGYLTPDGRFFDNGNKSHDQAARVAGTRDAGDMVDKGYARLWVLEYKGQRLGAIGLDTKTLSRRQADFILGVVGASGRGTMSTLALDYGKGEVGSTKFEPDGGLNVANVRSFLQDKFGNSKDWDDSKHPSDDHSRVGEGGSGDSADVRHDSSDAGSVTPIQQRKQLPPEPGLLDVLPGLVEQIGKLLVKAIELQAQANREMMVEMRRSDREMIRGLVDAITKPKTIVHDADGRPVGLKTET